jgi:hypothetical protein
MSVAAIEGKRTGFKRPKRPCRFALSCPLSARLTPRPTLGRVFSSVALVIEQQLIQTGASDVYKAQLI